MEYRKLRKMREEAEVEIIGSNVEEPSHAPTAETAGGALVEVIFQKNLCRTQKYLEAEPKALAVTQIMLTLFYMSSKLGTWERIQNQTERIVTSSVSLICIIAGGVALLAQNLHLPTLKACLGLQVFACIVSVVCFLTNWGLLLGTFRYCEEYQNTTVEHDICMRTVSVYDHIVAVELLVLAGGIVFSATLAAFCCKVIQCCSPQTCEPTIVVNVPPASQ